MKDNCNPYAFDGHIERRRAEILRELEEYKDKLMMEMGLVDKETLVAFRKILAEGILQRNDVKIIDVSNSSENGGENVVTFSDGRRLVVRNGLDGVRIVDSNQSHENGGTSSITFSDGTTIIIYNGIAFVPTVTTDDDGTTMWVVDGEWTPVRVEDSPIATYIDTYLADALGGEY